MIQQPVALSQLMIRKSKSVTTKTKGKIAMIINNEQIETLSSALQIIFQQFSSAPMSININTSTTTTGKIDCCSSITRHVVKITVEGIANTARCALGQNLMPFGLLLIFVHSSNFNDLHNFRLWLANLLDD
jgi:hypothetical protein